MGSGFSSFMRKTQIIPTRSKVSQRCYNEMTAQYNGRSTTCTAYTRQIVITVFFSAYFIIAGILIILIFSALKSKLDPEKRKSFDITWGIVLGVSLIGFAIYVIFLWLGLMSTNEYGSGAYLGRALFQKTKKKVARGSAELGEFQKCERRSGQGKGDCQGNLYYKPIKGGKAFKRYKCVWENNKCKSIFDKEAPKLTNKSTEGVINTLTGTTLGEQYKAAQNKAALVAKELKVNKAQSKAIATKKKMDTAKGRQVLQEVNTRAKANLRKQGIPTTNKAELKAEMINVADNISKNKKELLNSLACSVRETQGYGKEACEIGGNCKFKEGKNGKKSKCVKKFRWDQPFEGQPIPFLGDDCVACDEKGTYCNHAVSGLFATISFFIFGAVLLAFGSDLKSKLDEKEKDKWTILGDITQGLGVSYMLISLGILFFTLYCPEGSDWGDPSNDSWKGKLAASGIIILFIGGSIGIPFAIHRDLFTSESFQLLTF